jgi:hypothetical protein
VLGDTWAHARGRSMGEALGTALGGHFHSGTSWVLLGACSPSTVGDRLGGQLGGCLASHWATTTDTLGEPVGVDWVWSTRGRSGRAGKS